MTFKKRLLGRVVIPILIALSLVSSALAADLDCTLSSTIMSRAVDSHVTHKRIPPEIAKRTVQLFVKDTAEFNMILTKQDFEMLKALQKGANYESLAVDMEKGNCAFFEEGSKIFFYAFHQVLNSFGSPEKLAAEILVTKAKKTELKTDFPENFQELRNTVLARLSRETKQWPKVNQKRVAEFVATRYFRALEEIKATEEKFPYQQMVSSFMLSLDPHSGYSPADSGTSMMSSLFDGNAGVGMMLDVHPYGARVFELVAGGAAEKSKSINKGDIVVAVDGVMIQDADLAEVVEMIRGKEGTFVDLQIGTLKNGKIAGLKTVTLQRTVARRFLLGTKATRAQINGKEILTVHLEAFYDGAARDVTEVLKAERAKAPFDGVVLDLRGNGGGLLNEAVDVAGLFIPTGPVVAAKDYNKRITVESDHNPSVVYKGPLVIAINNMSASASEIVAGTLKDYKRALIVGATHSYGKGTVQASSNEDDIDGELRITVSQFYTVSGDSTQMRGVVSDVVVPGPVGDETYGELVQQFALPFDSFGKPVMNEMLFQDLVKAVGDPILADPENLRTLQEVSIRRAARNPEFEDFKAGKKVKNDFQLEEIQRVAADYASVSKLKK